MNEQRAYSRQTMLHVLSHIATLYKTNAIDCEMKNRLSMYASDGVYNDFALLRAEAKKEGLNRLLDILNRQ